MIYRYKGKRGRLEGTRLVKSVVVEITASARGKKQGVDFNLYLYLTG